MKVIHVTHFFLTAVVVGGASCGSRTGLFEGSAPYILGSGDDGSTGNDADAAFVLR